MNYELVLTGLFGVGCFIGGFWLRAHIQTVANTAAGAATSVVNRATTLPAGTPAPLSTVATKFAVAVDAAIADIAKQAGATPSASANPTPHA